jgi:superfamily I DNA/RNA helicase
LEQNYRSTSTILNAANAVIGHNTQRHKKVLWSACGQGSPIEVFVAPTDLNEAEAVAARMAKLHENGLAWKNMAILYRSNALSRQFELALMKQAWKDGDRWVMGIPYRIFGGTEFYDRKEVKDLFAYLRVIVNPLDQEALLRIVNQPRRGIGESSLDTLTTINRSGNLPLWSVLKEACNPNLNHDDTLNINSKALKGLNEFVEIIESSAVQFNNGSLKDALIALIERIDYKRAIKEEVKSSQMRDFKEENVQEFVNAIAEYEKHSKESGSFPSLSDFITSLPLDADANFKKLSNKQDENKVSLMTFHSSKGLEYSACFLVGVEDGIIPHDKSMLETGIEEERRLMYVAMTRAMQHLTLSMSVKRMRMGKEEYCKPSRFLSEIPVDSLKSTDWRVS